MSKRISNPPTKHDPTAAVAEHFPGWSPKCQVLVNGKPCNKPAKNWERRADSGRFVSRCDNCFFKEMNARRITKKVPALPYRNTGPVPSCVPDVHPLELFSEDE